MRYLYGATDEKHVRLDSNTSLKKIKPLDIYHFKLSPLLEGRQKFKFGEASIRVKTTPDTLVELCTPIVNAKPLPQAFKWSTVDVVAWITKLGFPQYQNTFKQHYINGRTLLRMDASYLSKINIKDFNHIRIITNSIRNLYGFNKSSYLRSISFPDRSTDALYKFFRVRNGPNYEGTRHVDLLRRRHLVRPLPRNETHWEILERWLKHLRSVDTELFGGSNRNKFNLFTVPKEKIVLAITKEDHPESDCSLLYSCDWLKEQHLRKPWILKCLENKIREGNQTRLPKVQNPPAVTTVLKLNVPHKYASDIAISEGLYSRTRDRSIKVRFSQKYFNVVNP